MYKEYWKIERKKFNEGNKYNKEYIVRCNKTDQDCITVYNKEQLMNLLRERTMETGIGLTKGFDSLSKYIYVEDVNKVLLGLVSPKMLCQEIYKT